jgi:hypothetical protein
MLFTLLEILETKTEVPSSFKEESLQKLKYIKNKS